MSKTTTLRGFLFTACAVFLLLANASPAVAKFVWTDYYDIEGVPLPEGIDPQIGGMDLNADGNLVACFHRGEVMIHDAKTGEWNLFASGLHEPLGLYVEDEGSILVVQRSELTRLTDEDGDGAADLYEVVCNDWGMSGNYHEFAFGLVKDSKQNIYVALGTASNGSGVREEVRGPWNDTGGLTHDMFLYGGSHGDWKEKKGAVPRMYARVPYRGCVLRIEPGSRKAKIHATGFRTPNGLFIDSDGQLWVSDNQGDWVGASKLHKVQRGGFHGHAASLLWDKNPPKVTPAKLPVAELDQRRVRAAALLPQGDCGNSPTQMLGLPPAFAPVNKATTGQILMGEMNSPRLARYMPDSVQGQAQGAIMHMLDSSSLGRGNNRMVFSPDGKTLFVGKTHLSWPGSEGLKKITYKGTPYLQVQSVKLLPDGFELFFNARVENTKQIEDYLIESYRILYTSKYGSPKDDLTTEKIASIDNKGRSIVIQLDTEPREDRIYDIRLSDRISSDLGDLSALRIWYTAHKVVESK